MPEISKFFGIIVSLYWRTTIRLIFTLRMANMSAALV